MSSTSWIRPAETAARGTNTNMITAIRTANRICMRYWRNAVRLPIDIGPVALSTRIAPNHMTATSDRLRIAVITGIVRANSRLTAIAVSNRSLVGRLEALLLVAGPDERPDDPDAGQRLARHLVDPVELDLHRPEQRDRPAHHEADDEAHDRQDDDEQARQRHVLADGHDDPADRPGSGPR